MKIKLTKNIVHSPGELGVGKHHKAGAVIDVPQKLADSLIERELAVKHDGKEAPPAPPVALKSRAQIAEELKGASKPDLGKAIATAKKVKTDDPKFAEAQLVIEVANELLKGDEQ